MKNYLLISLLLLFIGCGGGGGGAAAGGGTPNNQIPSTTVLINGQVIDGYIQNAKVCADLNYNQNCDNNEPSTLSDTLGNYSLTSVDTTNRFIPILAIGGLDNATNEPYNDTLIRIVDATSNTQNQIISPLGDLVAIAFLASSNKDLSTLSLALENTAAKLEISTSQLYTNPMQNKQVFAKTQYIEHIKKSYQLLSGNSLPTIKEQITQQINTNTLINFDTISANLSLGQSDKTFIAAHIENLKTNFNLLASDNLIPITQFANLQKELQTEIKQILQTKTSQKLKSIIKAQISIPIPQKSYHTPPAIPSL